MAKQTESNRPVFVARYGAIKANVWRNETKNGPMHNVTAVRSYKDGDDWKDSTSFGYDDLLVLAKALNDCHTFIHGQLQRGNSSSESGQRGQ
jgi:hypothetical protein